MFTRRKVATLLAEFLATGALTLVILAVQRSTIGVPFFVAVGAGLVAAMLVFVFGGVSGGHANPAITLAMWTARKVNTVTAVLYVAFQLLGAVAAAALYVYLTGTDLQSLAAPYTTTVMVAEAMGALLLALGWAAVAFRVGVTNGTRAAFIGVSYMLAIVVAAVASIGLVNPAVALGVQAWELFGSAGWGTYVLGPVHGAVLGVNLYSLLFANARSDDETVVVEEVVVTEAAVAAVPAKASKKTTRKPANKKAATKRSK